MTEEEVDERRVEHKKGQLFHVVSSLFIIIKIHTVIDKSVK